MIKELSNIHSLSMIDQNEQNNLAFFDTIDFEAEPVNSGGFSTVHKVLSIDGVKNNNYVVKIVKNAEHAEHSYTTIKLLHEKLKRHQLNIKQLVYHNTPELLGVPFAVFKATDSITNEKVIALLMYDLSKLGFEDLGEDKKDNNVLSNASMIDRVYYAFQLSKGISFLHGQKFIHSDLKESSIFINTSRKQLTLIDFDQGYQYDQQKSPITIGTLTRSLPNSLKELIRKKTKYTSISTAERIDNEKWIIAYAVFEIIFGSGPYFFLAEGDVQSNKKYNKKYEWPNVDLGSDMFNQAIVTNYDSFIKMFNGLENSGFNKLTNAFRQVFSKGWKNNKMRPSTNEWKEIFSDICNQNSMNPIIDNFSSDKGFIKTQDESVNFTWQASRYNSIYLDGSLVDIGTVDKALQLKDAKNISFELINDFSKDERSISIEAIKNEPKILSFNSTTSFRTSKEPVLLTWNVEHAAVVTISTKVEEFSAKGQTEVDPLVRTTYVLKATGYFGEVKIRELEIDVIKPEISHFSWKVDLKRSINDINLSWATKNTTHVSISPNVGDVELTGNNHTSINGETRFTLVAQGVFSSVEKELVAHPYPVPAMSHLFTTTPSIEFNLSLELPDLQIPVELNQGIPNDLLNTISFTKLDNLFVKIDESNISTLIDTNKAIKESGLKKASVLGLYQNIKRKIKESK